MFEKIFVFIRKNWFLFSVIVLVIIILIIALTTSIIKKTSKSSEIDFIKNPPYTIIDSIQGTVTTKGGNYLDIDYNSMTVRVMIIDITKFVDANGQPTNQNIDSIKIGSNISVQTFGGRMYRTQFADKTTGYTQAESIFIGGQ